MAPVTQNEKAQVLRDLHTAGPVLVLPNIWDPLGARVLAHHGFPAVATASAAISASLGYVDGEVIGREAMLAAVTRICGVVEVPVSADMEAGYGTTLAELTETTELLIETGAVGLNIEDSYGADHSLRPLSDQCERIAQVRATGSAQGVDLVINARVDTYLSEQYEDPEARLAETVARARSYLEAGADCIYPIGPGDAATLKQLRAGIAAPLNALATPDAVSLAEMAAIGINRVSYGPFIFRSCLHRFIQIISGLSHGQDDVYFGQEILSRDETARYLERQRENWA
jgi:2-methylisocitrate lyase-like PEP mutase family enzyme